MVVSGPKALYTRPYRITLRPLRSAVKRPKGPSETLSISLSYALELTSYLVFLGKIVADSRAVRDKNTQDH
jgi:hypothetical protein